MKKLLFVFVLMFTMFIPNVSADTEYYEFIWEHDWVEDYNISGIIDSIDSDRGFIAVGFAGEDPNTEYAIMFFNKDGSYSSMIKYQNTKLTKVLEDNGRYYAFGINEVENAFVAIEVTSDGKVVGEPLMLYVKNEVHIEEDDAYYVSVTDDAFYIYDFWYYSVYYATFRVDKNLTTYQELHQSQWDAETIAAVDDYYNLHVFYQRYIFDGTPENYEVTDSIPYKDGFLVANVDWDDAYSIIYYAKDGFMVWKTEIDNVFVKAIIPYEVEDIILISQTPWGGTTESIGIYDENGKKIMDDDLANYYPQGVSYDYVPEFFIEHNNGFMIASSRVGEDGDFATRLMYFSRKYDINKKISGEGDIEVVPRSAPFKEVTFEVKPADGYKLDYVKVIDADGNELIFTDYKFAMPEADVTIEAVFVPANPKTGTKIGLITTGILVITMIELPVIARSKKQDKLYNV